MSDKPRTRDDLCALLAGWGLAVEGGRRRASARARVEAMRAQQSPFRCLLVDVDLPDAESLARRLLADPDNVSIALILCLAAGFRGDLGHLEQLGYDACLRKPVRRAELIDGLLRVLGPPAAAAAVPLAGGPARSATRKRTPRLLVVEDNPINMMVMQGVLGKLGYARIDLASDGAEALAKARPAATREAREGYDLILMDCQMPKMDGYDATEITARVGGQDADRGHDRARHEWRP